MKVLRAQSAGFCWGVERAINMAEELAQNGSVAVFTDGPLIHNAQMMEKLEAKGISEVGDYRSESDLELEPRPAGSSPGVLLVRAHGISPQRRAYLKSLSAQTGMVFKDATCPDVGIIAGKVRLHAQKGYAILIFGDAQHPEAIGLLGYAQGKGYVVHEPEELDQLPDLGDKVCFVSQSTMFLHEFEALAEQVCGRYPQAVILDTICQPTKDRQNDLRQLVQQGAEAIVVIGGSHSKNTRNLARLAQAQGLPCFYVQTADQIQPELMRRYATVGVTAGASTPAFIIDAVCKRLEAL